MLYDGDLWWIVMQMKMDDLLLALEICDNSVQASVNNNYVKNIFANKYQRRGHGDINLASKLILWNKICALHRNIVDAFVSFCLIIIIIIIIDRVSYTTHKRKTGVYIYILRLCKRDLYRFELCERSWSFQGNFAETTEKCNGRPETI